MQNIAFTGKGKVYFEEQQQQQLEKGIRLLVGASAFLVFFNGCRVDDIRLQPIRNKVLFFHVSCDDTFIECCVLVACWESV